MQSTLCRSLAAICFSLLLFTVGAATVVTPASTAYAQDDAEAADGAAAADADDTGEGKPATKNALLWVIESLGWLYVIIFLFISFTFVAMFVMNLLAARRDNVCPVHVVETFEQHLNDKQYQEAYELAKNDDSVLGQVLAAGIAKLSKGYPQAIEAMQEVAEEENMKLEHRLSYIALIGTISPMVGLFGTVHGMIDSFSQIALGGGTPDPSKLAEGISKALLTTLVGLAIAIPALVVYNLLKNRIARLVLEVGILSEGLMSRFESVGKK